MPQKLIAWVKEFRLLFLLFVILPLTLGSVIVLKDDGGIDLRYYGLSAMAILLLHAGTIAYNDLFDYLSGNDVVNRSRTIFTGGTGLIPGILKPFEVFIAGSLCFGVCILVGLYLVFTRSIMILPIGLIGVGMGAFYSVPPLKLSYRLLGEITWFLSIPLTALGAFIVLTPITSLSMLWQDSQTFWAIVMASLPLAFMGTCGISILEFPDHDADRAVGKWNLVSVFGRAPGIYVIIGLSLLAYISLAVGMALRIIPLAGALMLITVPLMALAIRGLVKYQGGPKGIVMPILYVIAACIITGLVSIGIYL